MVLWGTFFIFFIFFLWKKFLQENDRLGVSKKSSFFWGDLKPTYVEEKRLFLIHFFKSTWYLWQRPLKKNQSSLSRRCREICCYKVTFFFLFFVNWVILWAPTVATSLLKITQGKIRRTTLVILVKITKYVQLDTCKQVGIIYSSLLHLPLSIKHFI